MQGSPLNRETLLGLAMAAIGVAIVAASLGIEVLEQGGIGPRVFPLAGGVAIAGLGVAQALSGLRERIQHVPVSRDFLRMLLLTAVAVAYLLGITYFGYLLATAFCAPVVLTLFGVRSPLALVVSAVLCPTIYHLVFFVGLGVFPPYGEWFDLLDVIQGY